MPYKFNPFTANFDYYQVSTGSGDISDGESNLLLTQGDFLLLTSSTSDVLLLTA